VSVQHLVRTARVSSVSRRNFLAIAGLGAASATALPLLAACSSSSGTSPATSSSGSTPLSVQLSWIEDTSFAPLYIADSKGYLADQKVSLDLIPGGADIGAIEGIVAGGAAQVGIATDITSLIAAIADGNPLICIGAIYQSNLNALMSDPKNPISTVKQLVGKRIGGNQGVQTKYDAMFKLAGLEPDYTFIPTGYGPDPLIKGDVDALGGFLTDEVLSYKAQTGSMPGLLTFTDAGLPAYTSPIFTTTDILKNQRDALKGMLAALRKASADDMADPALGAKLAVDQYGKSAGLDLASETEHNAAYVKYLTSPGTEKNGLLWIDAEYVAGPIFKGMQASGLKTPSDASKVVDTSLLAELPV
jgi:ABC-type nitrate/sulfonate/bicarbonate transport system substrate-binding protein